MTSALESSILDKVIDAIRRTIFLRDIQLTSDTLLIEDLGLDSLDVTEIVLHMEEVFGIEFSSEVIARFRRVADMVVYLSRRFFPDAIELTSARSA